MKPVEFPIFYGNKPRYTPGTARDGYTCRLGCMLQISPKTVTPGLSTTTIPDQPTIADDGLRRKHRRQRLTPRVPPCEPCSPRQRPADAAEIRFKLCAVQVPGRNLVGENPLRDPSLTPPAHTKRTAYPHGEHKSSHCMHHSDPNPPRNSPCHAPR